MLLDVVLLSIPERSWVLLGVPEHPRVLLSAPGCSWALGFPGRCWLLLGARSCSWALWEAPGCSCMRPGAHGIPGCSWLFFWDLCGRSWLLLGVPSWPLLGWYWALLDAPVTGSWCSQALLSAAERSCVLLVFPGRSWTLLAAPGRSGCSWSSWAFLGALGCWFGLRPPKAHCVRFWRRA